MKKENLTDFGREKIVYEIYKRLNKINQHKMKEIPVCLVKQD
jgi:NAD+ synthase